MEGRKTERRSERKTKGYTHHNGSGCSRLILWTCHLILGVESWYSHSRLWLILEPHLASRAQLEEMPTLCISTLGSQWFLLWLVSFQHYGKEDPFCTLGWMKHQGESQNSAPEAEVAFSNTQKLSAKGSLVVAQSWSVVCPGVDFRRAWPGGVGAAAFYYMETDP